MNENFVNNKQEYEIQAGIKHLYFFLFWYILNTVYKKMRKYNPKK